MSLALFFARSLSLQDVTVNKIHMMKMKKMDDEAFSRATTEGKNNCPISRVELQLKCEMFLFLFYACSLYFTCLTDVHKAHYTHREKREREDKNKNAIVIRREESFRFCS